MENGLCLESIILAEWRALDSLVVCGLRFLTPADALLVADRLSRHMRVAMGSSQTDLWTALVKNTFPEAPFSPCANAHDVSPGGSATWKDMFRLLAASGAGSSPLARLDDPQRRILVFSGPEIVPLRVDPDQQHLLRVKLVGKTNWILNVSLSCKSHDSVLLRERVRVARLEGSQETPVSAANRFKTMRHRLATMRFSKENDALAPIDPLEGHSGAIVLTSTRLHVQSSVFSATLRISEAEQVVLDPNACVLTLATPSASFVLTGASRESSSVWVAAIESLESRQQRTEKKSWNPEAAAAVEKPVALASKANAAHRFDPFGRLARKWSSSPQAPRIRSITCPGLPSNVSLLPTNRDSKKVQVLDSGNLAAAGGSSSSSSIATAFRKANRLLKTMSFADSAARNSTRFSSTPSFFKPQFTSRGAFPRFSKPLNEAILVKSRRRNKHQKRTSSLWSSFSSTTSESSHAEVVDGQQAAAPEKNRRASRSSSNGCMSSVEEHHHHNNSAPSGSSPGSATALSKTDESCRVRAVVFRLLQSSDSFEKHVCKRFFERQQQQFHDSTCPAVCRGYLTKVRDCIQDLVQFMLSFRLAQLQRLEDEEPQQDEDSNNNKDSKDIHRHAKSIGSHDQLPHALAPQVQVAVESYFYSSSADCSMTSRLDNW